MFSTVEVVFSQNRHAYRKLKEIIQLATCRVIKIESGDKWKTYTIEDLCNDKIWITYDNCFSLKFIYNKGNILCKTIIYEGDMCTGFPTSERISFTVELFSDFVLCLESEITDRFEQYLENEYIYYLEEQKQKWINSKKDSILKDCKESF
jgi:hypothetical protein